MKRALFSSLFLLVSLGVIAFAQGPDDPNEGSAITRNPSDGSYTFSWWGRAGRTYFLQQSDDLHSWSYLPVIESGSGNVISYGFTSNQSSFFLRLEYTDVGMADPFNDDTDGDSVSNYQELLNTTDPLDYFNGQTPLLTVVSGTGQNGTPGQWLQSPFTLLVTGSNGQPLANAPVTFTVGPGGGFLAQGTIGYPLSGVLTVWTDSNGYATVYAQLPTTANGSLSISVSAGPGNAPASARLSATVNDTPPDPPSNVVEVDNADGSIDLSWTESSTNVDSFPIRVRDQYGNWQVIGSVPLTQTSVHINPDHTLAQ